MMLQSRLGLFLAAARRRWRRTISIAILLYLALILHRQKHPLVPRAHTIVQDGYGFLPRQQRDKAAFCSAHNFAPYKGKRRKIYDLIMLNNEIDWLEIRMDTMGPYVDYFVVLESGTTFTGLPKELLLKRPGPGEQNWQKIKAWENKMIYTEMVGMPETQEVKRAWDREDFQRNALLTQGLLLATVGAPERRKVDIGDVLIVGDVDEIVRPETLLVLRDCDIPRRVTLRSQFYYYGFQWLHKGEQWAHPQATLYTGPGKKGTIKPTDLRNGEGGNFIRRWWEKTDIWNAAWHCSTCFAKVDDVLTKMESFSHTGLNQEQFRDPARIMDRVRNGKDLWDREGEEYVKVNGNNTDIPRILKLDENKERFGYLLYRDGLDAGFIDYAAVEEGDPQPENQQP